MTTQKKIFAQLILAIVALPAIMIFNDDNETIYINLLGIAYAWMVVKLHRHIFPGWLVEYIHKNYD